MGFSETVVAVLAVCSLASAENLCPQAEDTKPCGCVSDGESVRLDCARVHNFEDFRRALATLVHLDSVSVDVMLSRFDRPVPSDLFSTIKVRNLSFEKCELRGLGDSPTVPAFKGLEHTLEELTVGFSFPENDGMKYLNLSNLKALEILQLEGNYIDEMSDDWFRNGPKSLTHAFIMTNSIRQLGDHAFADLTNLRSLWFTNNKMAVFKRSMFPKPAVHLLSLDLSGNGIVSFEKDIFDKMPKLGEVILQENLITNLDSNTWIPVWSQLTRLYLDENPLNCDKIEWMFKYSRPYVLKGICETPANRKGQQIKKIVDDNMRDY